MKKLKLSEANLGNAEVLSREQLKKVLGGLGSGGGSGTCLFYTNCMIGGGFQAGPPCTGNSDPVYGCDPVEEWCYTVANQWCSQTPGCSQCVPY